MPLRPHADLDRVPHPLDFRSMTRLKSRSLTRLIMHRHPVAELTHLPADRAHSTAIARALASRE